MLKRYDKSSGAIIITHDPVEQEAQREYQRGKSTEARLAKMMKILGITEEDLDELPNPEEDGEVLEREE